VHFLLALAPIPILLSLAEYTHRIGRTGRAGEKGIAVSFVTEENSDLFFDLKNLLMECKCKVPPEIMHSEEVTGKPQKGSRCDDFACSILLFLVVMQVAGLREARK